MWNFLKRLFTNVNTGFLEERPKEEDYILGASPIDYEIRVFDGNWKDYLPEDEWQKIGKVETMSCVSFSALNSIEMQLNWMIDLKKISVNAMIFLRDNGYIVNNRVNLSDRFLAIMSDTTERGNYFTKVAQTIRKYGCIPEEELPFGNPKNFDEYHDKTVIDDEMLKLGEKFLEYFNVQYEWVIAPYSGGEKEKNRQKVLASLRHVPVQIAKNGHATDFFNGIDQIRWEQYDSYGPFTKNRSWNYDPLFVMKIVITEKAEFTDEEIRKAKEYVEYIVIKQHEEKYFFRPEANGEAYMVFSDGSFKYGTAKGSLFTQMTIDNTIVPVSENDFDKMKAAEIK